MNGKSMVRFILAALCVASYFGAVMTASQDLQAQIIEGGICSPGRCDPPGDCKLIAGFCADDSVCDHAGIPAGCDEDCDCDRIGTSNYCECSD